MKDFEYRLPRTFSDDVDDDDEDNDDDADDDA
jgi:hypothetical protein